MSQTDIIREFLVALGYKIDEKGKNKFDNAIITSTKTALKLSASVIGATAALEAFVHKVAGSAETLYFLSQRSYASIAGIQGMGYALSQLGSDANGANNALENIGEFLRNNPAAENYLNSLKVQTRDANGQLITTDNILVGLGRRLAQMPNYQAKAFADFFHIDEKTLLALKSGEVEKFMAERNRRLQEAGVNMEAMAVQGHNFENSWRRLTDQVGIFGDKLASIVAGPATKLLDLTTKGFEKLSQFDRPKRGDFLGGFRAILGIISASSQLGFGTASRNTSVVGSDRERRILSTLEGMGWTPQQASGVLANLRAESGLNPAASGDSGKAYGIAQWHPDRQALFKQFSGHDIRQSTLDEQLRFLNWELNNNESVAGSMLRGSSTPSQAGAAFTAFERPADYFNQARLRGADAERIYNDYEKPSVVINQTNNTTVNGASDPNTTAGAISRAQSSVNQSLTRNVAGAVN